MSMSWQFKNTSTSTLRSTGLTSVHQSIQKYSAIFFMPQQQQHVGNLSVRLTAVFEEHKIFLCIYFFSVQRGIHYLFSIYTLR